MTDTESTSNISKRRKVEGCASSSTSSTPTHRDDEPRRKAVARTICVPHHHDPKLVHYLDGHHIVRHSHTPFKSGGFCDIFTGDHPTYGKVAMRRPRMTEEGYTSSKMKDFCVESAIWKRLRHPNILQFLGLIQSDGHIWAVSPFAENGSLPTYLKEQPLIDRCALVFQLADAIRYLHEQEVVHGDIKGSNILISATGSLLLCDFGLSKLSGTTTSSSLSGAASVRWSAPELLFQEARKTYASDVYSFGMTIYEILSGNIPLHDTPNEVLAIKVIYDGARPPREPAASELGESYEHLWGIASESWDSNSSSRPSMEAICKGLKVTIDLPLATTDEKTSSTVDEILENTVGREQPRRGIRDFDERAADVFVRGSTSQIADTITDDEVIQKLPRAKAQYNSSLRRGARRCLQDTRVDLLNTLHGWIDGIGPHNEPIFWLSGEAGTGKSTIAHTIAEDRNRTHQLGASFFFSRNEEARRDANLFISTLAYQLSVFDKGFKRHLAASLREDPTLPEQTIKAQLKEMVIEPLKKTTTLAIGPVVVVVDALDECDPEAGAEEILEAWAELIRGFPLRLLVTSRPSWHIQARVQSSRHTSTVFHLHDISKIVVQSDIEHYLRASLADVLGGGLADNDASLLSQRVGMLFILASTYIKYIKDPIRGDPRSQLRALITRTPTLGRSPEGELNALYLDIVQALPEDPKAQDVIDAFKEVVGAMVVTGIPMTPIQLSKFLAIDQGDVLYVLRRLSSVIFLPDDSSPASFFHQSFSEFLTDPKRCTEPLYAIDRPQAHLRMALRCLDAFDAHLQGGSDSTTIQSEKVLSAPNSRHLPPLPAVVDTGVLAAQDSEIPEAISLSTSKAYPDSLCYASVYLAYHLQGTSHGGTAGDRACLDRFEAFYTQKRTQWLDVVASLHEIPGLNDLPARLHSGLIKYYQKQSSPSSHILHELSSFQRKLQPRVVEHARASFSGEGRGPHPSNDASPLGAGSPFTGIMFTTPQPRHTGPGPAVKPTVNAAGQRVCRQCGQPGRYKEGKCVERWGPGPAGPGTVCARCRKKMKRIERQEQSSLDRQIPLVPLAPNQTSAQQIPPQQLRLGAAPPLSGMLGSWLNPGPVPIIRTPRDREAERGRDWERPPAKEKRRTPSFSDESVSPPPPTLRTTFGGPDTNLDIEAADLLAEMTSANPSPSRLP